MSAARRARTDFTARLEPLEGRTLLSSDLIPAGNDIIGGPANITYVQTSASVSSLFFTVRTVNGGIDLEVIQSVNGVAHAAKLLKDFTPVAGLSPSVPLVSQLTPVGSELFFVANSGSGQELWVSNGTAAGTKQVKDLNPWHGAPDLTNLTAVGSKLFFTLANAGEAIAGAPTLYESNGTAGGTIPVPVAEPGGVGTVGASDLVAYGSKLYFASNDKLMAADGTLNGTTVIDTLPGSNAHASPGVAHLTVVNGLLFFTASDASLNSALYVTNGTASGTKLLKSFAPAASLSAAQSGPNGLIAVGSTLFFTADDATNGPALWTASGTQATLVKKLPVTSAGSPLIQNETGVGGTKLFFTIGGSGTTPVQLWDSDGTAAGTHEIQVIHPALQKGTPSIVPGQFAALHGELYFATGGPHDGVELWKTNGTTTTLVKDINPGPANSYPRNMAVLKGELYFAATDGRGTSELWKSNGTATGTVKAAALSP
jgi:ELWxxDGT repeat protein